MDWISRLETWPLLGSVLERLYERRFAGGAYGSFRGVFSSFDEAGRTAPHNKPLGFATEDYAKEFADRRSRIFSFDYPVLFWLAPLLRNPIKLFDYGGHCGTHFYAYSRYVKFSPGLQWVVCDLPEMTRHGAQIAKEQGEAQIGFTNRFEDSDGADVLLAAGSLQYVESPPFSTALARLKSPPQHVLINKLSLHEGRSVVTLQNGGVAYHPMYIFNRREFIDSICAVGYELIDSWAVPSHSGRIPFHPEASFPAHSGLYLRFRA